MARRARRKKKIDIGVKKEFTYRGLTVGEMQSMSLEEFLSYLPSRGRRNFTRGLTPRQNKFLSDVRSAEKNDVVRTHLRDMVILPDFFGKKIAVYDGKEFVEVHVTPEMVGHYLGEFALTRKQVKHAGPGVGATRGSKYMPLK